MIRAGPHGNGTGSHAGAVGTDKSPEHYGKYRKIVSHYRRYQAGCAKRRAEIDGEIAKLQEERKHLNELRWTEGLIRPVMAEIAHLTPEIEREQDKEYHPMGLRCAVPVFGRLKSSSQLLGITFTELGGELFSTRSVLTPASRRERSVR